jgi:hypothetical protein
VVLRYRLAALALRRPLPRLKAGSAILTFVRARILIAVAAWLLGAGTATGGCLIAVSLLGDGFGVTGNSSQQLTAAAVSRALAAAKRQQPPPPTPSAAPSRTARARPARTRSHLAPPPPAPTRTATQSADGAGTLLTSSAGTVVASCGSAGAYLLSWSPAQGYEVGQVVRGPAPVASVVFAAGTGLVMTSMVTMDVSCPTGAGGTPISNTLSSPISSGGSLVPTPWPLPMIGLTGSQ